MMNLLYLLGGGRLSTDSGLSWTAFNDSKAVIGQVNPPPITSLVTCVRSSPHRCTPLTMSAATRRR